MNRRFSFLLILFVGVVGVALVLWFILRPALPSFRSPGEQPPALTPRVETPFNPANTSPQPPTSTGPVDENSAEEKERQAQAALNRQAMDFAARQGTYSTADGFDHLRELYPTVTEELRSKLEIRRAQLLKDHPTFGAAWSQTMRTLSSDIDRGSLPLGDRTKATVVVQAQQITEDARIGETTVLVALQLNFVKRDGVWIPSDVTLQSLAP